MRRKEKLGEITRKVKKLKFAEVERRKKEKEICGVSSQLIESKNRHLRERRLSIVPQFQQMLSSH